MDQPQVIEYSDGSYNNFKNPPSDINFSHRNTMHENATEYFNGNQLSEVSISGSFAASVRNSVYTKKRENFLLDEVSQLGAPSIDI